MFLCAYGDFEGCERGNCALHGLGEVEESEAIYR